MSKCQIVGNLMPRLISIFSSRISLSSTVRSVLDNDELFYGYLRSRYTTLEDLLAHRMGVPGNNQLRLDDTLTRKSLTEYVLTINLSINQINPPINQATNRSMNQLLNQIVKILIHQSNSPATSIQLVRLIYVSRPS